jgi:hypothetical protein
MPPSLAEGGSGSAYYVMKVVSANRDYRLLDLIQNQNQGDIDEAVTDDLHFMEELNLNVSTEEFLSAEKALTYADADVYAVRHVPC